MLHSNTHYHPFTKEQVKHFLNELKEAGGVEELMIKKQSITKSEEKTFIVSYKNIEEYKQKHLTGIYENLRDIYKTEVPYVFWSKLYDKLSDEEKAQV